jgi:excisionase family DNA binding protein
MSREEAAKYLKVSLPTLNSWTKSGDIKAYRKKGRVYYKQHEIEESLTEIKWTPKKKFI